MQPLPRTVWALGLVSLLMDFSSELIHGLLPIYLTATLGVGVATLGLIEGVAEATASIVKVFSGTLSDALGKRKPLLLLGYGLAALTKPLFPLAGGAGLVFAARFLDRVGKGIRGVPRDALVASVLAGALWQHVSPVATFVAGGVLCCVTLLGLLWVRPLRPGQT